MLLIANFSKVNDDQQTLKGIIINFTHFKNLEIIFEHLYKMLTFFFPYIFFLDHQNKLRLGAVLDDFFYYMAQNQHFLWLLWVNMRSVYKKYIILKLVNVWNFCMVFEEVIDSIWLFFIFIY